MNYSTLFQHTDKYHAMLAHPGCISHGLNFTAADTVIWYIPITIMIHMNRPKRGSGDLARSTSNSSCKCGQRRSKKDSTPCCVKKRLDKTNCLALFEEDTRGLT